MAAGGAAFYGVIAAYARVAALLLFLALASGPSATVAAPAGWIEVAADNKFSIMAPPGTTFARGSGVDSFVGVFNAPGFAVHVDFGAHADPLARDRSRTQYLARDVIVDGKPAKLVTARSRGGAGYFIGMHVAHVRTSVVGPVGLTFTCDLAREQDYATLESVYLSLRFK